jgi:hypothetical protein
MLSTFWLTLPPIRQWYVHNFTWLAPLISTAAALGFLCRTCIWSLVTPGTRSRRPVCYQVQGIDYCSCDIPCMVPCITCHALVGDFCDNREPIEPDSRFLQGTSRNRSQRRVFLVCYVSEASTTLYSSNAYLFRYCVTGLGVLLVSSAHLVKKKNQTQESNSCPLPALLHLLLPLDRLPSKVGRIRSCRRDWRSCWRYSYCSFGKAV